MQITVPSFASGSKRHFIGGRWVATLSGQEIDCVNPATGQVLARIARGDRADIDAAVSAARKAFNGEWRRWTPHDRRSLLLRVHDLVEKHYEELTAIDTVDMGAPIARGRSRKGWLLQAIQFYATQTAAAGAGETLGNSLAGHYKTFKVKAPLGVVGGIIPWNSPQVSQWWILGPVLATGCTVVLKPAEDASLSILRMAELLMEAGMPEGVVNVVTGYGHEAGQALAEHPDVDRIAFTGSPQTGRKIVQASAGNLKRLSLELGGKSPDIVFDDADLEKAVPGAAMGVFNNTGQICAAGTRVLVQRGIYEEFVQRMKTFTATLKVGNRPSRHQSDFLAKESRI